MNPRLLRLVWAGAVVGLLLSGAGCSLFSTEDDDSSYFFIAEVLELEAPDVVDSGEALNIRISGYLGPTLCYKLDRIEMTQRSDRLDITVHGQYDHGVNGICLTALSYFDEVILIAPPTFSHDFTIVIHQPDGSTLEHTVVMEINTE